MPLANGFNLMNEEGIEEISGAGGEKDCRIEYAAVH
jgi:hypothetical protein